MTWREDKTLFTLSFFTVLFAVTALVVVFWRPEDGALYQTFSGLLTGFAGALMMHLKGDKGPPAGSTTETQVTQVTSVPPVVKP